MRSRVQVLVTGGFGFIGANLVRLLLGQGCRVRVFDNLSSGPQDHLAGLTFDFVQGDIEDAEALRRACSGMDAVVHLAAQTGVPASIESPRRDCLVNVVGTLNALEAARHNEVKRFVFASSNAPMGRQRIPAVESKAPLPISPYGASKLAGEGYCLAYQGSWGLGTIVLRFANVYGPFSAHKSSVVAKFIQQSMADQDIVIDGDGDQTRDFIHVSDLCRAIWMSLESQSQGEIFQVATGIETSILELAQALKRLSPATFKLVHGPRRRGDILKNYSDISKIKRMLGWEPEIDLTEGLRETLEWFQRQPRQIGP